MNRPPHGETSFYSDGTMSVVAWDPGNGARYLLLATPLIPPLDVVLGGSMLVALAQADRSFVAYAVSPDFVGHWTREYVVKAWRRLNGIVDHAAHWAMLLNWVLGGARARAYAEELWQGEMGVVDDDKKVVPFAKRLHRRPGSDA